MTTAISPLTKLEVECGGDPGTDTTFCFDPACGDYGLGFNSPIRELSLADRAKIAFVLATKKCRSRAGPTIITTDRTGAFGAWICIPAFQLLAQYPKDVVSVLDEALINLSKMVQFPSDKVEVNELGPV